MIAGGYLQLLKHIVDRTIWQEHPQIKQPERSRERMKLLPRMPRWPISETRGEPITAFGREITPVGRAFEVRSPRGSFIRHRPVAIEVREGDVRHRVAIPN